VNLCKISESGVRSGNLGSNLETWGSDLETGSKIWVGSAKLGVKFHISEVQVDSDSIFYQLYSVVRILIKYLIKDRTFQRLVNSSRCSRIAICDAISKVAAF